MKVTTGQVCGLAMHLYFRRFWMARQKLRAAPLPQYWWSASRRQHMLIRQMTTEHIINSLALLQRKEGRCNINQTGGTKAAMLSELAKRAAPALIGYVGPQALSDPVFVWTQDYETEYQQEGWNRP